MRSAVGSLVLALFLAVLSLHPAFAGRRVALVIGNASYENVSALTNPPHDAAAVAQALKAAGFDEVTLAEDLKQSDFLRKLRDFSGSVAGAETAVVYFAGHGVEVDGRNYLVPIDASLAKSGDVEFEAISLDAVRSAVAGASKLRVVVLDACRNNPFKLTSQDGKRAVTRGLARVEPGSNELVAYAAREGTVAADGGGSANSPYAAALVKYLAEPGLDVRLLFGRVRDDVVAQTGGGQEPFTYGTLGGETLALNGSAKVASVVPAPVEPLPASPPLSSSEAAQLWAIVEKTTSCGVLDSFIKRIGKDDDAFVGFAHAREVELHCGIGVVAVTPAAPDVQPPPIPPPPVVDAQPPPLPPPPVTGQQALAEPAAPPVDAGTPVQTRTLTPGIVPVGKWAEGIAFDGTSLWVAESGQRTIAALGNNGAVSKRVTVGRLPVGMVAMPDGPIYSLVQTDKAVWEQPADGKGRRLATLSECPQALAASAQVVWVLTQPDCSSAQSRAIRIDTASGKQSQTGLLGEWGQAIVTGHDKVWVAHVRPPQLRVIDPQTLAVEQQTIADASLWAIASSDNGIFAGGRLGEDNAKGLIVAIDPQTHKERKRLVVSELIIALALDEDHVVAFGEQGTIWVASAQDLTLQSVITLSIGTYRPSSALIVDGRLVVAAQQYQGENGAILVMKDWQ